MAEAAGLAFGTIALASLFNTCVELFDRFELGQNYAYDYQLACTKLCLLKARLSSWGISLKLKAPGHEYPALRQHWTEENDIVGRSLFGIKEIFENASLLAEKYKLTPTRSKTFKTILSHRPKAFELDATEPESLNVTTTGWKSLRKRTVWAIHDKQKFDDFIQNLSFLIDNLEKVKSRIEMASSRQESEDKKPASTSPSNPSVRSSARTETSGAKDTKNSGQQSVPPGTRPSRYGHTRNELLDFQQLAQQMNGSVFTGTQEVAKGVGVMGNVGKTDQRHLFTGGQNVLCDGFGVMGSVSSTAAAYLQESNSALNQGVDEYDDSDGTEYESNAGSGQNR